MEGTRNVQGCYVAKSKTQQMCRSQGINGQLVGLEQLHGSSFFVNVYQRVARNTFLPNTEHSPENVAQQDEIADKNGTEGGVIRMMGKAFVWERWFVTPMKCSSVYVP